MKKVNSNAVGKERMCAIIQETCVRDESGIEGRNKGRKESASGK